jgi:hypothetical protein
MRPPLHILLIFLLSGGLSAVESKPLTVVKVIDGTTVLVSGLEEKDDTRVHLAWTLPFDEVAPSKEGDADKDRRKMLRKEMRSMLPDASLVRLWVPDPAKSTDTPDYTTAIILIGKSGTHSVQEGLMRDGWALYEAQPTKAPPAWDKIFSTAVQVARKSKSGGWGIEGSGMAERADRKQ